MEIVLGILLLFGAFTLGSVTSDNSEHEAHAVQSESVASDHAGRQIIESDDRQDVPEERIGITVSGPAGAGYAAGGADAGLAG